MHKLNYWKSNNWNNYPIKLPKQSVDTNRINTRNDSNGGLIEWRKATNSLKTFVNDATRHKERSRLAATYSVCDSTKHNGLVTLFYSILFYSTSPVFKMLDTSPYKYQTRAPVYVLFVDSRSGFKQ